MVDQLSRQGAAGIAPLIGRLSTSNWILRRAVISALARMGQQAVEPLCKLLETERSNEAVIAATVDVLVASSGDPQTALERLARSPDAAVVYDAAAIFGRRRSAASVPLLVELTRHEDDNVAVAAIEALGRIGGHAAVTALIATTQSGNFFRTFPAIDVLGRLGGDAGIQRLIELLAEPLYTMEAGRALGRTGHERAVTPLLHLLTTANDVFTRVAATAIYEVHQLQLERLGTSRLVPESVQKQSASLGRRLAHALGGADVQEQVAIVNLLSWAGSAEAVPSLIELLDGDALVARAAAEALGSMGEHAESQMRLALREGGSSRRLVLLPLLALKSSSLPDLLLCLSDPDAGVRAQACDVIGRIGDPSAVASLFELLRDSDPRVVQAAVGAIQSLGSQQTEDMALAAAQSEDPNERRAALRIVSYFGYGRGIDVLLSALRHPDERLREVALAGLATVEDPRALDALLSATEHDSSRTRSGAMRALGQTSKDPRVTSALLRGLSDRDSWVRYYASQSLGKLNDDAAAEALVRLVDDDAGQVRVAVVDALAHLNSDVSLQALKEAAQSTDADMQRAALLGLGVGKHPSSVATLQEAMRSEDAATRLIALSALAEYDSDAVTQTLLRAAGDRDENVRNAAIGFLAARPGQTPTRTLVKLLKAPQVRERVVSALALPIEGRVSGLLSALDESDEEQAPLIVTALTRMRRADATEAIFEALRCANAAGRKAAAEAISALDTEDGREALAHAAQNDPDPDVRQLCTRAVGL